MADWVMFAGINEEAEVYASVRRWDRTTHGCKASLRRLGALYPSEAAAWEAAHTKLVGLKDEVSAEFDGALGKARRAWEEALT